MLYNLYFTSCACGDTICPRLLYAKRCGPAAAHPYACGAQRALLPVAVGAMNIHDVRDRRQTDDRRRQTRIIA